MLYIFSALYEEAAPLIRALSLKKNQSKTVFQCFGGEEVLLVLTGVGPVNAALAAGYILSGESRLSDCHLVSFGSAAGFAKGLYAANALKDWDAGRHFYPDLLFDTGLPEAEIVSRARLWGREEIKREISAASFLNKADGMGAAGVAEKDKAHRKTCEGTLTGRRKTPLLFDMEAAAIYQAGNHFLGPHQMHFLKFALDEGTPDEVSQEMVRDGAKEALAGVLDFLVSLGALKKSRSSCTLPCGLCFAEEKEEKTEEGRKKGEAPKGGQDASENISESDIERIALLFHSSATMKEEVRHLVTYADLAGIDFRGMVQEMEDKGLLPAADKREGKRALDALSGRICGTEGL